MRRIILEKIFSKLHNNYPEPKTELKYLNSYTFLIAVILSAQSTDISVNKVTKNLFKKVQNPYDMINFGERNLKKFIKTIGLYNSKAKNIINLSNIIIEKFNGRIPRNFEELISLPGVGNKTASVYQQTILKIPRIAVDTHVFRVSNRIGIVKTRTANITQLQLEKIVQKKWLMKAHNLLILHGRRVCKSQKPQCNLCSINALCEYDKKKLTN